MSDSRHDDDVEWYSARLRGVIPMEAFHVGHNVRRVIRQGHYEMRTDTAFRQVMEACAERDTTWISDVIIDGFTRLHNDGYAHSVEIWLGDVLAGGLYGVALKGAFFGESMFKTQSEMDKIALWHCHQILQKGGFVLWDTQFYTDHLAQFGCVEITAAQYQRRLKAALRVDACW